MRFIKEITLFAPSGTLKRFQGLETSFKVEQGKISALISESELTELRNGNKTMYSRLYSAEQTVNGLDKLYTDISGKYDVVSGQYTDLESKTAEYKESVDGFSTNLTKLSEHVRDDYSDTEAMQSYVSQSIQGLKSEVSQTYVTQDILQGYSTTAQMKASIGAATDQVNMSVRASISSDYCTNNSFTNNTTGWKAYRLRVGVWGEYEPPTTTYLEKRCAYLSIAECTAIWWIYNISEKGKNTIVFKAASKYKTSLTVKIDQTVIKTISADEMSDQWTEYTVELDATAGEHKLRFETTANSVYVTDVQILQNTMKYMQSEIAILQDSITSKVSKDGIASAINQTAQSVLIQAAKINFNGLMTANNYFQILTDGSFKAIYGTLGGWTVKDGIMKSNDQKIVLDPANNKIYFKDDGDDHMTELSPDGTRTNYLTVDGGSISYPALLIDSASSSRIAFYDSFSSSNEDEIVLNGNLEVLGSKSRVVKTKNFSDRLLYCYETPTPMFGDLGCGTTNDNGTAIVDIDPAFSETINSGIEYQVFLQKEGDGDIWVEEKNAVYFMVQGTPNLKFSWEVKCIQRNYEHLRLTEKEVQEAAQKDARDSQKEYDIIIDTVVEDYDKEMEELINESN